MSNLISDEEEYTDVWEENEEENNNNKQGTDVIAQVVDKIEEDITKNTGRPKQINAGAGVNRLQMNVDGKTYKTAKYVTLLTTNGETVKKKIKHKRNKYMDIANKVMFTKISAKAGIKKFGETLIVAMFKEFN